ncbi:MAG: endonuclease/exonuclease/phosphatase family protein [Bacteroidota bacterium]
MQTFFKSRSFFQWLLIVLTLFFVFVLLLSYLSYFISPIHLPYLAFFGLAYPYILLANIIFAFVWIILWKRVALIPMVCIIAGYSFIGSLFQFEIRPETPASGSIKMMSFNIHNLVGAEYKKQDQSIIQKVINFFHKTKPEIVCFQEFKINREDTSAFFNSFRKETSAGYYFYRNYNKNLPLRYIDALATFSKYPIINSGFLTYPREHIFAIYNDIVINDEKIRVYNVHLESIHFANDDYSFYSNLAENELNNVKLVPGIKNIVRKLKKAFVLRAYQAEVLRSSIDKSPYPIVMCGDFNDTPSSYTYRYLSSNMNDAFKKAGRDFFGSTYAGNFPAFRIDYILYDKRFKAYQYQKLKVDLSDHYPVSLFLNISPAQ